MACSIIDSTVIRSSLEAKNDYIIQLYIKKATGNSAFNLCVVALTQNSFV